MNKIFICTSEKGNHYIFKCMDCCQNYDLIIGDGRYGNLGTFVCPGCGKKYYATIDDHENPSLYVAQYGEQPNSMLDSR